MVRFCSIEFCFYDAATTESYTYGHTLSLHGALPICRTGVGPVLPRGRYRPGDTEIKELGDPVTGHQNVGRGNVAVNNQIAMGKGHRVAHGFEQIESLIEAGLVL